MKKINILAVVLAIITMNLNAQITWYPIDANTTQDLEAIHFVESNPAIGYIGGDNILLKTTDYGVTWNPVEVLSLPSVNVDIDVTDIHFFTEDHGFMTSDYHILETFDGGSNWVYADVQFNCFVVSMNFQNEGVGFFGGSGCFEGHVIVQVENGESTQVNDPENWAGGPVQNDVISIEFRDEFLGLAGTAAGDLLRTEDGGLNWDTIPNIANDSAITDFIFEEGLIRATHANNAEFGTMVSMDDGLTWEYDSQTATFFYPQMYAAHRNESGGSYLGGIEGNGNINGVIFNNQSGFWYYDMVEHPIRDIESHSDSVTFCVGEQGAIYVSVHPDVINSVSEIQSNNYKVFPNPANSVLNITGEFDSNTTYMIYDMGGKEVLSGRFEIFGNTQINVEELSPGIYTAIVQSNAKRSSIQFSKD